MREFIEFTLMKDGVPYSEIDNVDDKKLIRWFSITTEINKIREENSTKGMRV